MATTILAAWNGHGTTTTLQRSVGGDEAPCRSYPHHPGFRVDVLERRSLDEGQGSRDLRCFGASRSRDSPCEVQKVCRANDPEGWRKPRLGLERSSDTERRSEQERDETNADAGEVRDGSTEPVVETGRPEHDVVWPRSDRGDKGERSERTELHPARVAELALGIESQLEHNWPR